MEKITIEDTIENIAKNTNREGLLTFVYYSKYTPYTRFSYFTALTKKAIVTQYIENKAKYEAMTEEEKVIFESDHIKKTKEREIRKDAQERRRAVADNVEAYRSAVKDFSTITMCIHNLEFCIKRLKDTLIGIDAQKNNEIVILDK